MKDNCPHKRNVIRCANHLMTDFKEQGFFFEQPYWDRFDMHHLCVRPLKVSSIVSATLGFRCEVSKKYYPDGPCYKLWVPSGLDDHVNTVRSMVNGIKVLSAIELWAFQHGKLIEQYPSKENRDHPISFSFVFSLNHEVYEK